MQRDYILRLIEQAAVILRHVLARIRRRTTEPAEVVSELRRALHFGGLDLDLLRICNSQTLLQLVAPTGEPDATRTWLAAETLFLDGLALQLEGYAEDAARSLRKALMLFRMLEPSAILPTGFPEATERIAEIEAALEQRAAAANDADEPSS